MTLGAESSAPFGRVLTAMVTPFDSRGELDLEAAVELAHDLVDLGNDGLVVNGTTGESPTTTDAEKAELVAAVVSAVGDRATVVAGVGTNHTGHTVELAKQAAAAGADGLLVVTPYYNKPPVPGLLAHFTTVADSTDLPIMLYDIPGRTGLRLGHDVLVELAKHPNIVANKDATGDPAGAAAVLAETDLSYYSGDDALNLALQAVGAVGYVSVIGHVVADRLVAMQEAFRAGRVIEAQQINAGLVPITAAIMTHTQAAIAVKAVLDLLQRPGGGNCRLPLLAADDHLRATIRAGLESGGLTS